MIKEICADLSAGFFKRRTEPQKFDQGWFNQGYTKLEDFVKANWYQGKTSFATSDT